VACRAAKRRSAESGARVPPRSLRVRQLGRAASSPTLPRRCAQGRSVPAAMKRALSTTSELDDIFAVEGLDGSPDGRLAQTLRFANRFQADEPVGMASIASCLALVAALISNPDVKRKLLSFLGFQNLEQLLLLKDPERALSVLLAPAAIDALVMSRDGYLSYELWDALNARLVKLQPKVEDQLNEMLKEMWDIKYDLFAPNQVVPEGRETELVAALVSVESISVKWDESLREYEQGYFTTSSGSQVKATFCVDLATREMPSVCFPGGKAVLLLCEPNEETKKQRAMLFVLPHGEDDFNLDKCLEALAGHVKEHGFAFGAASEHNFSFPAFNASKRPASIKSVVAEFVPEIFKREYACMEGTLPGGVIGGTAFVGDVQHGASIKADREGAKAEAVTVATVEVYRSLSGLPEQFHCNRPFVSILVTLKHGTEEVETIEFVTKHETAATLDLSVAS